MSDGVMRVDEVAAHNLLLALGMDVTDGGLQVVAGHLAAHRVEAERFLLSKAQEELFSHLENAFMRMRAGDGGWQEGYAAAEREALAWIDRRGHARTPPPPSSTGQILRSMIRARRRDGHDGRNYP
jgi:hypothetical protein